MFSLLLAFLFLQPAATRPVKVFLVALGDAGKSGKAVGCDDSLVAVDRMVPRKAGVLAAAVADLLSIHDLRYGESGLYSALASSALTLQKTTLHHGVAEIRLAGTLAPRDACDASRIEAQIAATAKQFPPVKTVSVFVNGRPLHDALMPNPTPAPVARPAFVDITWMSVSNMYYELGPLRILTDGYITRIPRSAFSGGGGGMAHTDRGYKSDEAVVTRVMNALGGPTSVDLLLTGHSHFDHAFDTGTWARLTGARVIGAKTTCLQVEAEKIPASRCTAVVGGEAMTLADGVTMRVVRWNHSGDPQRNPEQHNPVELEAVPVPDPATGGLHGGVAEDFPNGGGARGYLFVVDGAEGRFSWFFQNSASAFDLQTPIVVNGVNYGAPLDNLKAAMKDAGLESVDLWIGSGGLAVAELVAPVIKPKAYLPVHWDSFYSPFQAGVNKSYADPSLEAFLMKSGIALVRPLQYMDKWRLDARGVRSIDNAAVKRALGF